MPNENPEWWDESKLVKIRFEEDERGWAIDMGDGTYRLVNGPIRGLVGAWHPYLPQWGDLVQLVPSAGKGSWLLLLEKHPPEDEFDLYNLDESNIRLKCRSCQEVQES